MYLATHRHALVKQRENQFEFEWIPASTQSGGFLTAGVNLTKTSPFATMVTETGIRYAPPPDSPTVTRLMLAIQPGTYEFVLTGTMVSSDLGDRPIEFGWNQYALDNSSASYPNRLTDPTVLIFNQAIQQDINSQGQASTNDQVPDTVVINTTVTATLTTGQTRFYIRCLSVYSLTGTITVKGRRIASL